MIINQYKFLIKVLFIICSFIPFLYAQNLDSLIEHSLHFAEQQLTSTITELNEDTTLFPYYTRTSGNWRVKDYVGWISGWFPGCLWYMFEWTSDEKWQKWAESWTSSVDTAKTYTRTHDVGFIIFCSYGNGYRIKRNENYQNVLITAAQSLATRYNSTIGAFTPKDLYRNIWLMIDTMMNLELILWASKNGGDPEWYNMVVNHALKSGEDLVREDGSTFQDVYYDSITGDILFQGNHQGQADSSTWARGHAWGLYGFTMVYRYTRDIRFLETAQILADYFIDNLPEDYVPCWDFDALVELKDVSAAAIAVSGLLELSTFVFDAEKKEKYWNASLNILTSLCSPSYLAEGSNSSGILLHGIQNYWEWQGIDASLIYADYYFIEALLRYKKITSYTDKNVSIQLLQNFPNPFNSETNIRYWLSSPTYLKLRIYDSTGRLVQTFKNSYHIGGAYQFRFNAEDLSSGLYFIVLNSASSQECRKMVVIH
jgi:unsaturated chondroitin disaccharide hydrolase